MSRRPCNPRWLLAVLLLAAAVPSCDRKPRPPDDGPGGRVIYSNTRWTEAERDSFYHLAEGSEVIPFNMLRALHDSATGRPIMASAERYGLLPDPRDRLRRPVGLTAAQTVDSRLLGITMSGFNCAACHTNELRYNGRSLRVDGAPGLFNTDALVRDLKSSISYTIHNPRQLIAYFGRLILYGLEMPPEKEVSLRHSTALTADAATADTVAHADSAGHAQAQALIEATGDTAADNFEARLYAAIRREADAPALDQGDGLGGPSNEAEDVALAERYDPDSVDEIVDQVMGPEPLLRAGERAGVRAAEREHLRRWVRDLIISLRLLKDRLETLRNLVPHGGGTGPALAHTAPGAGRVDAFGGARNAIYVNSPIPMTAPVSYPWLWDFPKTRWLHYDANTNSVMERNMGQAIGVGAVWDRETFQSTLNPYNIHKLEMLARAIPAPEWPEELFGPVRRDLAERGRPIYQRECAGCHFDGRGQAPDWVFDLPLVGADTLRATNFATLVPNPTLYKGQQPPAGYTPQHFTTLVAPVLTKMKEQAYRTFNVPLALRDTMNGCPNDTVWRTTRSYGARPLAGAWATAPYLHNGSVPTLYDLLRPVRDRPRQFSVGGRNYDPQKLGFTTIDTGPNVSTFNVDSAGNSNSGHEWGTQLSESDRNALLEYLKIHTVPVDSVYPCPPGPNNAPPTRISRWPMR